MYQLKSSVMIVRSSTDKFYYYTSFLLAVTVQFSASAFNVSENNDHPPITLTASRITGLPFYIIVNAVPETTEGNQAVCTLV